MCGIVGVLGNHEVAPLLVEALKRLEYRGYDSAGIATVTCEVDVQQMCGDSLLIQEVENRDPVAELVVAVEPIPVPLHAKSLFGLGQRSLYL